MEKTIIRTILYAASIFIAIGFKHLWGFENAALAMLALIWISTNE